MRESDLGIDKRGVHSPELSGTESVCLRILQERGCGKIAAIPAIDLANRLFLNGEIGKRNLRTLINHLIITHSKPIVCEAGVGGGYYLPGDTAEVERFNRTFHSRSMTGLLKASRGRKAAYADMMYQYSLGFDDPKTQAVIERLRLIPDEDSTPVWVKLITKFLDRISSDPVVYSAEIRRLQEAYGDIFLPREKVTLLKQKTAEFQKLLSEIA